MYNNAAHVLDVKSVLETEVNFTICILNITRTRSKTVQILK